MNDDNFYQQPQTDEAVEKEPKQRGITHHSAMATVWLFLGFPGSCFGGAILANFYRASWFGNTLMSICVVGVPVMTQYHLIRFWRDLSKPREHTSASLALSTVWSVLMQFLLLFIYYLLFSFLPIIF